MLNRPFPADKPRGLGAQVVLERGCRKAGIAGEIGMIASRRQGTERRTLPFVVAKDSGSQLCQFKQVECFLAGGDRMPLCQRRDDVLYFQVG